VVTLNPEAFLAAGMGVSMVQDFCKKPGHVGMNYPCGLFFRAVFFFGIVLGVINDLW
jgi:hypothetical protein